MRTKTVLATMFKVERSEETVSKQLSLETQLQCEIRENVFGKSMVYCFANGEHVGCFAMKGGIGFTMLPNTIYFGQEVMEKMPQKFEAKVVDIGVINPGQARIAYRVEVEVPEDVVCTFAEEDFPCITETLPSYPNGTKAGSTAKRAGCGVFYSIVEQLPNLSSDDLVTLRHRIDKELSTR